MYIETKNKAGRFSDWYNLLNSFYLPSDFSYKVTAQNKKCNTQTTFFHNLALN